MPSKTYIIGTRGSLLALTQCNLIKEEMEKRTGAKFELKIIKTQGDQVTDKALWQLEGKDFFTRELDEALLKREVDLVVHSYKDLGSERPEGITLAAITRRKFSHDILLIKNSTILNLKNMDTFKVGTSSPRRIVNVKENIHLLLPNKKNHLKVETEILRGNVNTRIKKLQDGQYDAIILAMAGLERLCGKPDSKLELTELISNLNFSILPQSIFPSAAAQGALAIECHAEASDELKKIIASVHDEITESCVKKERAAFKCFGGGCHLAVGINTEHHELGFIHFQKGQKDELTIHKKWFERKTPLTFAKTDKYFVGSKGKNCSKCFYDELSEPTPHAYEMNDGIYFVTSKHCLHSFKQQPNFSAGMDTTKDLVARGFWVNGSADNLGHKVIENFQQSELIKLFYPQLKWFALSHDEAKSSIGPVVKTYTRRFKVPSAELKQSLSEVKAFYWTSYDQYKHYSTHIPSLKNAGIVHASGLGKTLEEFTANGVKIVPFLGKSEFILTMSGQN